MTRLFSILALLIAAPVSDSAVVIARRTAAGVTEFPTSGLVSGWRLEEGYDAAGAFDGVGSNDLTAVNDPGSGGAGKLGYARDFDDASSECFTITDAAQTGLDFTGSFSFSVWVNHDNYFVHNHPVFAKWDSGFASYSYILQVVPGTPNETRFAIREGGTTYNVTPNAPSTGQWVCYQGYYDSAAGEIGLRIDGGAWTTNTSPAGGGVDNSTAPFAIGAVTASGSPSVTLEGLVDDLYLWSRKLTDDEFNRVHDPDDDGSNHGDRKPYAVPTTNLVSYWPMDETSGNAADSHGANTLTETGTVGSSTGILNNARVFVDDAADYLDNNSIALGSEFIISAWVHIDASQTDNGHFVVNADVASGSETFAGEAFHSGGSWREYGTFTDATSGTEFVRPNTYNMSASTWYHVVFRVNTLDAFQVYEVYRNGIRTDIAGLTGGQNVDVGITLGRLASSTVWPWYGRIDEVAVYNATGDAGIISELYGSGSPPSYP